MGTPMAPFGLPRNLFTHEDARYYNVHKILGISCLVHFLLRFLMLHRDMKFTASWTTPCMLLMHALLSCSSLIFHVPTVRIKEGSRIWPEFRLHSIVFALRSLSCMMIVWAERRYETGPQYWANVVVVFATLKAADISTNSVPATSRSNTIRGLAMSPVYKYSFSFLQFLGTTGCLVGLRSFGAQFAIVFIIQTYAFTLTLRRKNIVTHYQTVLFYSIQLGLGVTCAMLEIHNHGGVETFLMFSTLAVTAFSLRAFGGLSKYVVWALMSVLVQFARRTTPIVPAEERLSIWPAWGWAVLAPTATATFAAALTMREMRKSAAAGAASLQKEPPASQAQEAIVPPPAAATKKEE